LERRFSEQTTNSERDAFPILGIDFNCANTRTHTFVRGFAFGLHRERCAYNSKMQSISPRFSFPIKLLYQLNRQEHIFEKCQVFNSSPLLFNLALQL